MHFSSSIDPINAICFLQLYKNQNAIAESSQPNVSQIFETHNLYTLRVYNFHLITFKVSSICCLQSYFCCIYYSVVFLLHCFNNFLASVAALLVGDVGKFSR